MRRLVRPPPRPEPKRPPRRIASVPRPHSFAPPPTTRSALSRWRGVILRRRPGHSGAQPRPARRAGGRLRRWCRAASLDAEPGQALVVVTPADRIDVLGATGAE